ncbi:hypothetical protein Cgig2_025980 [Carnegiea gigantea]|uniref:Uncharacterized protein n=1 Tax=Carnegiea gigantea TaxID=171969 RepID=A0A9Q1GJ30_9CARY|nr:hypothetical protein Cgig2_025980 [Carnegiea gigantea]
MVVLLGGGVADWEQEASGFGARLRADGERGKRTQLGSAGLPTRTGYERENTRLAWGLWACWKPNVKVGVHVKSTLERSRQTGQFPLLSKCLRLQKLCTESPDSSTPQIIQLPADFPGGIEAFELCAKFCYGITITISAYNIVATRCAAEYLQMTEEAEKGNLINKLEVFLNSCILQGWKDSIVTLQTTKAFPAWSEDLAITSR